MADEIAWESELVSGRCGKIARLPREIRDEVNRRLDDGAPGDEILLWLNSLPVVRELVGRHFGGAEVNKHNLSNWRLGAFQAWRREEDALRWIASLREATGELREAICRRELGAMLSTRRMYELSAKHDEAMAACRTAEEALETLQRTMSILNGARRQDHRAKALELRERALLFREEQEARRRETGARAGRRGKIAEEPRRGAPLVKRGAGAQVHEADEGERRLFQRLAPVAPA